MLRRPRFDRWEAPDHTFVGHRDILVRNLARYHFVAPSLKGNLLDVGCGRGYGLEALAYPCQAVGLDASEDFLRAARQRKSSLPLICAPGERLPIADQSFDSIISFEVIEHIHDDVGFLREIKRVTRPSGFIALSTPNRSVASGDRDRPLNVWHCREYTGPGFLKALNVVFPCVTLFSQYEQHGTNSHKLVDRVPITWKYLLPTPLQDLLSVALRAPLRQEDCRFTEGVVEHAHTFLALIQL